MYVCVSPGALSIGVSQLKNLLGLSVPDKDYTYQTLAYILSHLQHGRLPSLVRHSSPLFLGWECEVCPPAACHCLTH